MSRKAKEDKSTWHVPGIYAFTGGYGPYKPRPGLDNCLVLLTSTTDPTSIRNNDHGKRHAMYRYAGQAQQLLLHDNNKQFTDMIVVDVADMFATDTTDEDKHKHLQDMISKEIEEKELVKGFGRTILRLLQRLELSNATITAEGELCTILLKLVQVDDTLTSNVWFLHPEISAGFINNHLVGMNTSQSTPPLNLNLIFKDEKSCNKREGIIRSVLPEGMTQVLPNINISSLFGTSVSTTTDTYNEEYFNEMGKSLYLSKIRIEMNKHSKQYEQLAEDITSDLLIVIQPKEKKDDNKLDLSTINWNTCEQHVGALVLRGNRCLLVRSLKKKWNGMRIPSVLQNSSTESINDAAVRCVVEHTGVDATEARVVDNIPTVTVYAPNDRLIRVTLVVLYATESPPPGMCF